MFKIRQHYAIKAIRSSARTTSSSSYNVFNQPNNNNYYYNVKNFCINNNNNRYMTTNHSNHETFQSEEEHIQFLESISTLPKGFRVGTSSFHFNPVELPTMDANMNMTVISLDNPSNNYAGVFTKNAFPGSPIIYGRKLLQSGKAMKGIVINNKISNVRASSDGVQDATDVANACLQSLLHNDDGNSDESTCCVLPSSTGYVNFISLNLK